MEKNILFISSGTSFMVNAVRKNLKAAGFNLIDVTPTMEEIDAHAEDTDLYVFFLGDFVSQIPSVLAHLGEICTEREKMLVLLGNPVEFGTVEETIPSPLLAARFERPFDMQDLVDELDHLLEISSDNSRRKSILLVDDDSAFLKMVKGWLMSYYRVTIVTSGTQALLHLADNKPDLILLDYEMPVISGPQVLEMIRSENKVDNIPVIFLTGKGDRESVMKVLSLKPDGYFLKSTSRDALLQGLNEFFEKRKYEQLHKKGIL